jgi:hypothetical protein
MRFSVRVRGALVALLTVGTIVVPATPSAAAAINTKINSGPSGPIAARSATFRFGSNVSTATFQCKLDDKGWSTCSSPKTYSKLSQGGHTFSVRARRSGSVDATPAVRTFAVDTVRPDTQIDVAPQARTYERNASFFFSSNEAGTFECRLTGASYTPCSSPFVAEELLPDRSYSFEVRARDEAGNLDKSPPLHEFSIITFLSQNLETATVASEMYFPSPAELDVPASCGGDPTTDCPDGMTPLPPSPQLAVSSTRSVVKVVGASRFDVTLISDVTTAAPINVTAFGLNCNVTMTSANGATPTWKTDVSLHFTVNSTTGEMLISHGDLSVSTFDSQDFSVTGGFLCSIADWGSGFFIDIFKNAMVNHGLGRLCTAVGPEYLASCPENMQR